MFDLIVDDMVAEGGEMAPSEQWNWNLGEKKDEFASYSDELYDRNYSHLERMLDPWVGVTGMKLVEADVLAKYEPFLRKIDHLRLLPEDMFTHTRTNGWRETDFGSILDVSLITMFSGIHSSDTLSVCEVGGGYGRLAEVFLQLFPKVHYVLIDAVPGSLMYAYLYLKSQFPELKIGSYYAGDSYGRDYHCYILPAWRAGIIPDQSFDVCANIESMQEMAQHHVDHYIRMFDRLAAPGGWIYLSNARDYFFKGSWNIPAHWESRYLNNTPRSWTADHPTHILRKGAGDHSLTRAAHEGAFARQVGFWRLERLCNEKMPQLLAPSGDPSGACSAPQPGEPPAGPTKTPGLTGRLQRLKRRARKKLMRILGSFTQRKDS